MLTGCNQNASSNDASNVTINVYNWGDYIAPNVIEKFTQQTGIEVIYETFDTNESMYTKLKSGAVNYDVLFPSDYMIQKLISEDLLYPLNKNNLPNYSYIEDNFRNLAFDVGNVYSIPYTWGTVGILYNTTMVDEPVDSWDILWNEKYANSIIMQNSVRDTFGIALKKLGYSINTINKEEVEQAKELLIQQKPLVSAYVIDEVKDKMIGNEAALAVIYSGEAQYTYSQNSDLAYVVPKEGSNVWVDAMCIPNSSKHKEAAEKFINYLCESDIAYLNASYIYYGSPHSGAKEMLAPEILENQALYPSQEIIDRCEVYIDLGTEMNQFYDEKWTELKGE
jgi:spermidine/putrescine transport system substrate-binding protein